MGLENFLSKEEVSIFEIVDRQKYKDYHINLRHYGGNIYLGTVERDEREEIIKVYTSFYNTENKFKEIIKLIDGL